MENSKILIGICFYENNKEKYSIELFILRDATFQNLYDGIRWGLKKHNKSTDTFLNDFDNKYKSNIWIVNHIKESIIPYHLNPNDFSQKLCDLGFVSSTRVVFSENEPNANHYINIKNIIDAFKGKFPKYNISSRQLHKLDNIPIDIISPSEPPKKTTQPFIMLILPSMLLIGTTLVIRSQLSSNFNMILLSLTMAIVTLVSTLINYWYQDRRYKKDLNDWKENYTTYINSIIKKIITKENNVILELNEMYPEIDKILIDANKDNIFSVFKVNKNIFSRSPQDEDFLTIRLGNSNMVETPFKINGTKKDNIFSQAKFSMNGTTISISLNDDINNNKTTKDKFLSNLPNEIATKYKYLNDAPLLLSLKNCGSLGIVSEDAINSKILVEKIIFELCYYHSSENLQIIMFFDEISKEDLERQSKIEQCINKYKFMPHFRDIFNDKSSFVFDKESANSIFSNLIEIMNERQNNQNEKLPHIILIIYEEYGLKEHALAKYLPQPPKDNKPYVDDLGITFIFIKQYEEHLPNYCSQTIKLDTNNSFEAENVSAKIFPREDDNKFKQFNFPTKLNNNDEQLNKSQILCNAYELLSTLYYSKISQNTKVPSNVSVYELFGITGNAENNNLKDILEKYWHESDLKIKDVTSSLTVPIGKTEDKITYLDLHEKGDGPHMLVAGTTGSGKSETIISYLVGLCIKFRPDEINLMLVDMKGEGFVGRIGDLPHVSGKVTDVDDDDSGIGAEYMLKRFLNSLTAEIKRRKLLFKKMSVDSIDKYIFACNNLEKHIEDNLFEEIVENGKTVRDILKSNHDSKTFNEIISKSKKFQEMQRLSKEEKLTHLILVVDEFTELKRFSNENNDIDFIGRITTIARIGRSLGLHIILISQNIEGAITDDIRVNSKARLCLKVATRQASKDMIHTDLAASPSMPGNGRAYLLVGTGSRFEYFQSAYSGANASSNNEIPIQIIEASKTGNYTTFYNSNEDNEILKEKSKQDKRTQLSIIINEIKKYYNAEKQRGNNYKPHIVFQPPLPKRVIYKNGSVIDIDKDKNYIGKERI